MFPVIRRAGYPWCGNSLATANLVVSRHSPNNSDQVSFWGGISFSRNKIIRRERTGKRSVSIIISAKRKSQLNYKKNFFGNSTAVKAISQWRPDAFLNRQKNSTTFLQNNAISSFSRINWTLAERYTSGANELKSALDAQIARKKEASSAESVGGFWFGKVPELMI